MKISVIGLGAMGSGITKRLLETGHTPVVWNRSPEPAEALGELGAVIAKDVKDALDSDVIFHVLYNDDAVRDVFLTPEHLEAIKPDTIMAGMSTISVALAGELDAAMTERKSNYVGTCMFGRPDAAESGKLQLAVGGAKAPLARIADVLDGLGQVWQIGDTPASAHAAKLGGNYLIANSIASIGESAAIAASAGDDPANFLEMITQTLFSAPISKLHADAIIKHESPDDKAGLDIVQKDVRLGLDQAKAVGTNLPLARTIVERFDDSKDAGHGNDSAYGIYQLSKDGK
ncbi:MAG: NAD(P)-dependent oxidoreductase [Octadecabacter sp.]